MTLARGGVRFLLSVLWVVCARPSVAQRGNGDLDRSIRNDVFRPLVADLLEPQFFATYLVARTSHLAPRIGSVGFGQTMTLLNSPSARWQLGVGACVFSQFNMASTTNHLMNTDYVIGLPFSVRSGARSARIRLYHQSSHLGEEFLDGGAVHRQLLSFEAVELLLADDISNWRIYGGGEYRFIHAPDDLKPTVAHAGIEYEGSGPLVRFGRFGSGRLVAALDGKSFEDRGWQVGWSLKTGLALSSSPGPDGRGLEWSLIVTGYRGPTPYGQFYRENLSSIGIGLALGL